MESDGRPALQVLAIEQDKWFQAVAKVYFACAAGKKAYFVIDNHYCFEPEEIRQKCQEVRAKVQEQACNRRRRKRFDKGGQ